jgi:NAD(P)-dependent dehydrogenase (short-subunit alcohol dehydrogenase family)
MATLPGSGHQSACCDVTKRADCDALAAQAISAWGRIDVLVNIAGLWVEGPTEDMSEADWDRVVDVNLKGTFFACSRAIPELKKTQGCIINLSSDAGLVGTPETAVYTASKGGVSVMTKALAIELAPHLVRVNAVCPADIMTPMLQYQADTYGGGDPEGYFKRLLASYFQGGKARFITPEEVAELIFFLASPPATPITGANISIDFGLSAGIT